MRDDGAPRVPGGIPPSREDANRGSAGPASKPPPAAAAAVRCAGRAPAGATTAMVTPRAIQPQPRPGPRRHPWQAAGFPSPSPGLFPRPAGAPARPHAAARRPAPGPAALTAGVGEHERQLPYPSFKAGTAMLAMSAACPRGDRRARHGHGRDGRCPCHRRDPVTGGGPPRRDVAPAAKTCARREASLGVGCSFPNRARPAGHG